MQRRRPRYDCQFGLDFEELCLQAVVAALVGVPKPRLPRGTVRDWDFSWLEVTL